MDELDDLAAAARSTWQESAAPKPSARAAARPGSRFTSGNGPLVILIAVMLVLVVGGIWLANRAIGRAPAALAQQPVAPDPASDEGKSAAAAAAEKARALHLRFTEFSLRFAEALGKSHAASLQANAVQTGDEYTASYQVRKTEVVPQPPGSAAYAVCRLELSGNVDVNDGSNSNTETYRVTAAFNELPGGQWKLVSAATKLVAHKGTADLFRAPDKLGDERDLTHIDWVHNALTAAQPHR